jgi:hypothetical protein
MEVGFASASVKPFGAWFDSLCHAEHVAALSCPHDGLPIGRRRRSSVAVHHRCQQLHSGAVGVGKRACLGAVWDAEREGMLGHAREVTGGELAPSGPPPLSRSL